MKRKMFVLLVIAIMALLIAGCTPDDGASTGAQAAVAAEATPTPISFTLGALPTIEPEEITLARMNQMGCVGFLYDYTVEPFLLCGNNWTEIQLMGRKPLVKAPNGRILLEIYIDQQHSDFRLLDNNSVLDTTSVPGSFLAKFSIYQGGN